MYKYMIIAIIALLTSLIVLWSYTYYLHSKNQTQAVLINSLTTKIENDKITLKKSLDTIKNTNKSIGNSREEIKNELKNNKNARDWADSNIPDGVRNSLNK